MAGLTLIIDTLISQRTSKCAASSNPCGLYSNLGQVRLLKWIVNTVNIADVLIWLFNFMGCASVLRKMLSLLAAETRSFSSYLFTVIINDWKRFIEEETREWTMATEMVNKVTLNMNTLRWTAPCYLEEDSGESLDEWNSLDSETAPGDPEQHVPVKSERVNGRIIIFEFFLSFHLRIQSGVSSVCAVCRYQPRGWLLPKHQTDERFSLLLILQRYFWWFRGRIQTFHSMQNVKHNLRREGFWMHYNNPLVFSQETKEAMMNELCVCLSLWCDIIWIMNINTDLALVA